jgi:hypothetical protein
MEFEIIVLKDANLIKYFDFDYQFFGFVYINHFKLLISAIKVQLPLKNGSKLGFLTED